MPGEPAEQVTVEINRVKITLPKTALNVPSRFRPVPSITTPGLADRLISAPDQYFMISERSSSSGGLATR